MDAAPTTSTNVAKNIWTINDLLEWADKIRAWRSTGDMKETI